SKAPSPPWASGSPGTPIACRRAGSSRGKVLRGCVRGRRGGGRPASWVLQVAPVVRPLLRSDDLEAREVRAVTRRVAGEEAQARDRSMRADVEVGQGRSAGAAPLPIPHEGLASQKRRLPRQRKPQEIRRRQCVLEILDL